MDIFDGVDERFTGGVFKQIAVRAIADGIEQPGVSIVGGQDEHFRAGEFFLDRFGGVDAVHDRHLEVH